jgi:hypothetical protein
MWASRIRVDARRNNEEQSCARQHPKPGTARAKPVSAGPPWADHLGLDGIDGMISVEHYAVSVELAVRPVRDRLLRVPRPASHAQLPGPRPGCDARPVAFQGSGRGCPAASSRGRSMCGGCWPCVDACSFLARRYCGSSGRVHASRSVSIPFRRTAIEHQPYGLDQASCAGRSGDPAPPRH